MRVLKWIAGIIAALLMLVVFALETSKVTLTPAGSYKAIYPLFGVGIKGNLFLSGATENFLVEDYPLAGPIVSNAGTHTEAKWFCRDKVEVVKLDKGTKKLGFECAGSNHQYQWQDNSLASAEHPMPEQMLVLSDIHGDIDYLDSALQQAGITDDENQWIWQQNHLVILGDSVDRGPADRQVLWRLYQLSNQAKIAGGAVHMVLGNHEQYGLDGFHFLFHPDVRAKTKSMLPLDEMYNQNTVIGNWLRSSPVMLKIGDILFAHAGLSDLHLSTEYTVEDFNKASLAHYSGEAVPEKMLNLLKKDVGVTRFRGQLREDWDNTPTQQQLKTILTRYGASRLIIGHSSVEKLTPRYDGMVWPAHANHKSGQVLLVKQGEITVKKLAAKGYNYDSKEQVVRNFSFINGNDFNALMGMLMLAFR